MREMDASCLLADSLLIIRRANCTAHHIGDFFGTLKTRNRRTEWGRCLDRGMLSPGLLVLDVRVRERKRE